uniref:Uncharacterized protein n=1 Tax=Megaselia scalaris TaxID=36166 RepID=T1GHY6_MEGSC
MFVNTPPPGRQHFARYDSLDEKTKSGLFSKIIDGMPAATMFSKFKSGSTNIPQNPWDTNPICQQFEIGKQTASAGPEMVWKIHDAMKKSDGRYHNQTLRF